MTEKGKEKEELRGTRGL